MDGSAIEDGAADGLAAGLDLQLSVEDPAWLELDEDGRAVDVEGILRRAVLAALAGTPEGEALAGRGCELTLMLTDDARMRDLNRTWRGIDKPTDVLSFPGDDGFVPPEEPLPLGDIVLARETMLRDAEALGRSLPHHFSHIAVHGVLHLLGWDHEEEDEAEEMEAQERRILQALGFADDNPDEEDGAGAAVG